MCVYTHIHIHICMCVCGFFKWPLKEGQLLGLVIEIRESEVV